MSDIVRLKPLEWEAWQKAFNPAGVTTILTNAKINIRIHTESVLNGDGKVIDYFYLGELREVEVDGKVICREVIGLVPPDWCKSR